MSNKTLGERVRDLRTKNKMTQDELARKMGTSYTRISDIERGVTLSPRISTLRNMAKILEVSLTELIGE